VSTLSAPPERHLARWIQNATDFACDSVAAMGGRVLKNERVAAADLGRPAGLFNSATLLRRPRRREFVATLADLDRFYDGRAPRVTWLWSAWPTPDLGPVGWQLGEGATLMVREPGEGLPAGLDLDVREVADEGELRAWESTVAYAFPLEPAGRRHGRMIDGRALADERLRLFVGWDGDRPVSTASSFTAHGVNQISYVATVPEARGLGYGAAVTELAAAAVPSAPAMLLARAAARPLCDRLGFTAVGRFTEWFRD